ncbi:integral membrane protein [Diaporthe helianthi]|uniref:Integral membrane protein n=1 Tax=Diaporthe helianthi TaxID=158607 RepID=A0A2P5HIK1_DIAHE|nr:integral membrane protein [Diaporthe helianthi]
MEQQSTDPEMSPEYPPLATGGVQLLIICWIFTPLAIVAVGLRFWARRVKRQSLVLNDWVIAVALVFNCGQTALLTYASVYGGIGHHMAELVARWPETVPRLLKCYVAAEPFWITTNSLVKFSLLDFYVKVFSTSKTFRHVCWGMMAVVGAYWFSTFVRMFFLCTPFAALWDPSLLQTVPDARCLNLTAVYLSVSVINLLIDVTLFLLPMPLLWGLHMPQRKKLMLMGIFGLGLLVCVITGLRIESVLHLDLADVSYTVTGDGIWSTMEPCLGIINACLPLYQPLGQRVSRIFVWSTVRSGMGYSDQNGYREDLTYAESRKKVVSASQSRNNKRRPFVPLEGDQWTSDELEAGWTVETGVAMDPIHESSSVHCAESNNRSDSNKIQVTRGWEIDHRGTPP